MWAEPKIKASSTRIPSELTLALGGKMDTQSDGHWTPRSCTAHPQLLASRVPLSGECVEMLLAESLSQTLQSCLHFQDSHSLRASFRGHTHGAPPARATGANKAGFPGPRGHVRVSHATTPALALRASSGSPFPAFQGRAPLFSLAGGSAGLPLLLGSGPWRTDHMCLAWPHSTVFFGGAPTQTPGLRRQASHPFPTLIRQREPQSSSPERIKG